jgi:hypothetical protein
MKTKIFFLTIFFAIAGVMAFGANRKDYIRIRGKDFQGGAWEVFGDVKHEVAGVNYVYAQSTGKHSSMNAKFQMEKLSGEPLYLHIMGRDDNYDSISKIEILINGTTLFKGESGFPNDAWLWKTYPIPENLLRKGENEIMIKSGDQEGKLGMPPWFMLAECAIDSNKEYILRKPGIDEEFRVILPPEGQPLPPSFLEGAKKGFNLRGTKGWLWKPEQYMEEIPFLGQFHMNFLMNCYGSMCDIEHYPWGDPNCNRWWEPLPPEKKKAYEEIVQSCKNHNINFCFSMNPNLGSKRILDYNNDKDIDDLWKHYEWMQNLGVKWFNISLDDISQGIDAQGQARVVNEIFRRLREKDKEANFIFTPTHYWGTGENDPYLKTLSEILDKDVFIFWTGDGVVSAITRDAAQAYKRAVGRRLFLWDNYPVNDAQPTLHLGPVIDRDPDLCEVIEGYMSNPLHSQNQINRIPLFTCADYALNPYDYDPERSILQAIWFLSETKAQRKVLADLVELYPGFLILKKYQTGWNPVRTRFSEILNTPHSHFLAKLYLGHVEDVLKRMGTLFPNQFSAARKTVEDDLKILKAGFKSQYGENP